MLNDLWMIYFPKGTPHLAVKSVPAGEQGVLAETRGCPGLPSPSSGRVDHLQLCVPQRPVDAHARGLSLLLIVGTAQPYRDHSARKMQGWTSVEIFIFIVQKHSIKMVVHWREKKKSWNLHFSFLTSTSLFYLTGLHPLLTLPGANGSQSLQRCKSQPVPKTACLFFMKLW